MEDHPRCLGVGCCLWKNCSHCLVLFCNVSGLFSTLLSCVLMYVSKLRFCNSFSCMSRWSIVADAFWFIFAAFFKVARNLENATLRGCVTSRNRATSRKLRDPRQYRIHLRDAGDVFKLKNGAVRRRAKHFYVARRCATAHNTCWRLPEPFLMLSNWNQKLLYKVSFVAAALHHEFCYF